MKKLITALPVIGLLLLLPSGCEKKGGRLTARPGAMFRANLERTGFYKSKDVFQISGLKWKFKTGGKVHSSPVVADGVVYFGSYDGYLYALH
jgi:hypothetical protein